MSGYCTLAHPWTETWSSFGCSCSHLPEGKTARSVLGFRENAGRQAAKFASQVCYRTLFPILSRSRSPPGGTRGCGRSWTVAGFFSFWPGRQPRLHTIQAERRKKVSGSEIAGRLFPRIQPSVNKSNCALFVWEEGVEWAYVRGPWFDE